jgi:hypothetical protein
MPDENTDHQSQQSRKKSSQFPVPEGLLLNRSAINHRGLHELNSLASLDVPLYRIDCRFPVTVPSINFAISCGLLARIDILQCLLGEDRKKDPGHISPSCIEGHTRRTTLKHAAASAMSISPGAAYIYLRIAVEGCVNL